MSMQVVHKMGIHAGREISNAIFSSLSLLHTSLLQSRKLHYLGDSSILTSVALPTTCVSMSALQGLVGLCKSLPDAWCVPVK